MLASLTLGAALLCALAPAATPGKQMRASFFEWDASQTPEQWRPRMQKLHAQGYNSIILMGHHTRFSEPQRLREIIAAIARLADTAHSEGLKLYEHHSAVLVAAVRLDEVAIDDVRLRDMAEVTADTGEPYFYEPYGGHWLCPNNPDYRRLYMRFLRELCATADIDGLMCDDLQMLPDATACACGHCRERFRRLSGHALPPREDRSFWFNEENALWRQWIRARQTSVGDFYRDVSREFAQLKPGAPLFACQADPTGAGLPTITALSVDEIDSAMDIRFLEDGPGGVRPDYLRALLNLHYLDNVWGVRKPVLDLYYAPNEAKMFQRWACDRVTGACTATIEPAMYFKGFEPGLHMRQFHEPPAGRPVANLAVVYSPNSRDFRTSLNHMGSFWEWGFKTIEAQASIAVLTEDQLEKPEALRPFGLVLLPTVVCMSHRAAQTLRRAADGGLSIAYTQDCGRFDETGARRLAPLLASALGSHPNARVIASRPQSRRDVLRLMRWANTCPVVSIGGIGRAFWRAYDCGAGRYEVRVMQGSRRANRPWTVRVNGAAISQATLRRTIGEALELRIVGGAALVPQGAAAGYCQLDIVTRHR